MIRGFYRIFLYCLFFTLVSCGENYTPKPRAYQRIIFPERKYEICNVVQCNYSFEIPVYANIKRDPYPGADTCWYNVHFRPLNATLHLSYMKVQNREQLFKYIDDSRTMVYKHVMKAEEIVENYISANNLHGIFYELDGNTATNVQFYVTDSTTNFLRGSLYFNENTKSDSVAPVLAFLKQDILHLIKTIKWE